MNPHFLGSIRLSPLDLDFSQEKTRNKKYIIGETIARVTRVPRLIIPIFFAGAVFLSVGTSASFTDDTSFPMQSIGAGEWIPSLNMKISPLVPDGENGSYSSIPCVTFTSNMDTANVYYEFSNDGNLGEGATKYDGSCIPMLDEKEFHIQAIAVNPINDKWRSALQELSFTVMNKNEKIVTSRRKNHESKRDNNEKDDGKDENQSISVDQDSLSVVDILPIIPTEKELIATLSLADEEKLFPTEEETASDRGDESVINKIMEKNEEPNFDSPEVFDNTSQQATSTGVSNGIDEIQ